MKVTHAQSRILQVPAESLASMKQPAGAGTRLYVSLELETDEGIEGIGLTTFGGALTGVLRQAVDSLCELVMGENPLHPEAIATKLQRAAGSAGPGGIFTLALAAIDIALWDIKGKVAKQSVQALLGGYRERVPTYASGMLMGSLSRDELAEAGAELVARGFRQMKMQLGAAKSVAEEVERVRTLRGSVGDGIELMGDANQRWKVKQAIQMGQRLEPYQLLWLEDVVVHDDYQGMARVADVLTTNIVAGEYHYGIVPFRWMLEARAVDIVMIDLFRVGGITQWRKVAGMAEAFNLPVVSHVVPEINVHLVAGVPNGLTVEFVPWTLRLFEETPVLEDGELLVPQRPGLGVAFNKGAVERYEVR